MLIPFNYCFWSISSLVSFKHSLYPSQMVYRINILSVYMFLCEPNNLFFRCIYLQVAKQYIYICKIDLEIKKHISCSKLYSAGISFLYLFYWVTQKLPQIYTVIAPICIWKVSCFQYIFALIYVTLSTRISFSYFWVNND